MGLKDIKIGLFKQYLIYIVTKIYKIWQFLRRWPSIQTASQQIRDNDSMLAHRLRRWPNINPTLDQSLVLAGIAPTTEMCRVVLGWQSQTT